MAVYSQLNMEAYSPLYNSIYNNTLDVQKQWFEQEIVALNIHEKNSFKHSIRKGIKSDVYMKT